MPNKPMSMTNTPIQAAETAVTSVATKWGMGGGTIATAYGWLTHSGTAVAIGILVTLLGFWVNWIFQRRRDRREIAQAELRYKLEMAEESRRIELHQAQLAAIKITQEKRS